MSASADAPSPRAKERVRVIGSVPLAIVAAVLALADPAGTGDADMILAAEPVERAEADTAALLLCPPAPFSFAVADALVTTPDEAVAWLRAGMAGALERLAGVFGREALGGLAAGLREQLADAMAAPDPAKAHRIAGLGGTLGLTALHRPWQALSEGEEAALGAARRAGVRALAAIEGFLG